MIHSNLFQNKDQPHEPMPQNLIIYAQGKRKSWKAKGNLIKLGPIINLVGVLGHWDKSQPSESSVDPHERVYTKKNLNYLISCNFVHWRFKI